MPCSLFASNTNSSSRRDFIRVARYCPRSSACSRPCAAASCARGCLSRGAAALRPLFVSTADLCGAHTFSRLPPARTPFFHPVQNPKHAGAAHRAGLARLLHRSSFTLHPGAKLHLALDDFGATRASSRGPWSVTDEWRRARQSIRIRHRAGVSKGRRRQYWTGECPAAGRRGQFAPGECLCYLPGGAAGATARDSPHTAHTTRTARVRSATRVEQTRTLTHACAQGLDAETEGEVLASYVYEGIRPTISQGSTGTARSSQSPAARAVAAWHAGNGPMEPEVCTCIRASAHPGSHADIHARARAHACMYACMHAPTHACAQALVHVYTHVQTLNVVVSIECVLCRMCSP